MSRSKSKSESKIKSPIKAIRAYCLDCSGDSAKEVKECPCTGCFLYPFRFGKNPYVKRSRDLTDKQKKEIGERLKKSRRI